ncbi:hypothetical protein DPMN_128491 [Dreissena polymorpha]|uniref:Uncharacterized protein n=1 Tax=Dreissena polymorpha TaxID=45954 RepID=A0A9D4JZQ7_DREPO|nr:hypothetical protein DPMN_128491 [Dreissena polymorpha]
MKIGKINVASRVLTRTNALPPDIIWMNLLIKFHEHQTINVASREKNAPPLGIHVFQANVTIFEFIQDIIETNLLTKFHEDWTKNVASRVLTRLFYSHIRKNAPPPGGYVFQPTVIIFELEKCSAPWQPYWTINVASRVKNAPPPGSHVFQPTGIIFEVLQDIIGMNLLTKFHEDRTINVTSGEKNTPPLGSHVFQANTNLLTKFHEDRKINVASKVLTRNKMCL